MYALMSHVSSHYADLITNTIILFNLGVIVASIFRPLYGDGGRGLSLEYCTVFILCFWLLLLFVLLLCLRFWL